MARAAPTRRAARFGQPQDRSSAKPSASDLKSEAEQSSGSGSWSRSTMATMPPAQHRQEKDGDEGQGAAGGTRGQVEQRRGLLSERPLVGGPSRSHEGPSEEDPGAAHAPTTRQHPRA